MKIDIKIFRWHYRRNAVSFRISLINKADKVTNWYLDQLLTTDKGVGTQGNHIMTLWDLDLSMSP
ncbi:hypothetical protein J6590_082231, partial [Homalodisca vitripennis]